MPPMSNQLYSGRKSIESDGTGQQWKENSNIVIDLGRFTNKRNLATILTLSGVLSASVGTALTADTTYNIRYKDDHFYNLLSNVQVRLNGTTEVKNVTSLALFRYIACLQNRGKFPYEELPTSVTIKSGATSATIPFKLVVVIPYAMFDQIGATQTNIATWLFSSFQLTAKCEPASVVFNPTARVSTTPTSDTGAATLSLQSAYVNCDAKYWIVEGITGTTQLEYLQNLGNLYVSKVISKGFAGGGKGQFVELTPNLWARDFTIVLRNSQTNERLDNILDRVRIADGNNVLVDTKPEILKNEMMSKFSLSQRLFDKTLADSADNKGVFYGVYRIDTNYFGEMNNSLVIASWNQPRLIIDFNDNFATESGGEQVLVEVYQNYEEAPQLLQQIALAQAQLQGAAQG